MGGGGRGAPGKVVSDLIPPLRARPGGCGLFRAAAEGGFAPRRSWRGARARVQRRDGGGGGGRRPAARPVRRAGRQRAGPRLLLPSRRPSRRTPRRLPAGRPRHRADGGLRPSAWTKRGKAGGAAGGKATAAMKVGVHAPGMAAKGGQVTADKKVGAHAPGMAAKGGKAPAAMKVGAHAMAAAPPNDHLAELGAARPAPSARTSPSPRPLTLPFNARGGFPIGRRGGAAAAARCRCARTQGSARGLPPAVLLGDSPPRRALHPRAATARRWRRRPWCASFEAPPVRPAAAQGGLSIRMLLLLDGRAGGAPARPAVRPAVRLGHAQHPARLGGGQPTGPAAGRGNARRGTGAPGPAAPGRPHRSAGRGGRGGGGQRRGAAGVAAARRAAPRAGRGLSWRRMIA